MRYFLPTGNHDNPSNSGPSNGNVESLPASSSSSLSKELSGSLSSLNGGTNGNGNFAQVNTTSQHYALIESDHPYKPATVANYKV